jgi:hypothetical protein
MIQSAIFSSCGNYRYELRREWDAQLPGVVIIGLNPSTADHREDDATTRVCINYARRWGFGKMILVNLFAYCSTDPRGLRKTADPVGPDNDDYLKAACEEASLSVCAWSSLGRYRQRDKEVLHFVREPHCLTILKDGSPGHPLYKKKELTTIPFVTWRAK